MATKKQKTASFRFAQIGMYWQWVLAAFCIPIIAGCVQSLWFLRSDAPRQACFYYGLDVLNISIFSISGLINILALWPMRNRKLWRVVALCLSILFWTYLMFLIGPAPTKL